MDDLNALNNQPLLDTLSLANTCLIPRCVSTIDHGSSALTYLQAPNATYSEHRALCLQNRPPVLSLKAYPLHKQAILRFVDPAMSNLRIANAPSRYLALRPRNHDITT
ncbi:hypothetical protein CVT26_007767 [Gymnopilus dilepis]|uniref:Uncharacterized protein n=1 Tax=Gymnopilus dilepis TaxID=231916 RepID=A0A409WIT7_9AGAR|nr:hypothetical protein CVT26_007767 [Gymnopilus dilepis]